MSVRIHAIAKEINKTSKEVLEILSKRGYDLKSASSTIDNIYCSVPDRGVLCSLRIRTTLLMQQPAPLKALAAD